MQLDLLPQAYQDAVHIAKKLGIRFLWIDSLCIVQGGQDGQDWASEAGQMEKVFALAYCTIDISSASDVGGTFKEDVENGEISTRGWILQERALSRRTIYFSAERMYWECGAVIWSKAEDRGERYAFLISQCAQAMRYLILLNKFLKA
jgi:hypothetical protein